MNTTSFAKGACAAVALAAAAAGAATLDGIAAKVNDDVITIGEVAASIRRSRAQSADMDFGAAYSNAVNQAVDRRLILREAVKRKLEMQEWVVDNRVREIVKDNFGGDNNKLKTALAQSGTDLVEWRNQIRDEMIVQAMCYQMVEKDVQISPAAMQAEYQLHRDRYCRPARTTVSVILLRPPASKGEPSVEARAKDVFARIAKGEAFADLAKRFSADSHAKSGGQWKDVDPGEAFRPEIAAAIAKLGVGKVSSLVNLDGWGFIVRKDAESAARELSFREAYDEIAANVRLEASAARYKEWVARLRKEAFIRINPPPSDN
jgi:parvulin-like peptidyl-prolyl isomerase